MIEIWRDVVGYDGKYQVSNFGRVKSFQRGERILKLNLNRHGYLYVRPFRDGKYKNTLVHRLVAQAFVPNPESKREVNHINGIKADNRAENLEWVTASENQQHAFLIGLRKTGEGSHRAKLTNAQVVYIRDNPDDLNTCELARTFGVDPSTIHLIQLGKTYRDAGGMIREPRHRKHAVHLPGEVREQIRAEYVFDSRESNTHVLAKKYGIAQGTVWRIVREGNN